MIGMLYTPHDMGIDLREPENTAFAALRLGETQAMGMPKHMNALELQVVQILSIANLHIFP